ncbi:MAG: response regulator transcription factor [Planctomycetes bacterium]|nr:response regulator transcription factor [Planctomycetota bacterium]
MDEKQTVFIVDDDKLIRDGIANLVKTMLSLEALTFATAEEFLKTYDPAQAGCLVLDVCLPGMSGLELQARLKEQNANLPIVIISGHGDVPMAVQAVKAGAVDFIEKPFREHVLWENIKKALAMDAQDRADRIELADIQERIALLSDRERGVMELVLAGKTSKEIADKLGLSHKTVETHRTHIMEKLGVRSAVQLTRLVCKSGLE